MKLHDYIQGNKKGKEARDFEKDALRDPFLYEAMEGFDAVDDDHMARLTNLQQRLDKVTAPKRRKLSLWVSIAASIVMIVIAGGILNLLTKDHSQQLYVQAEIERPIDIYIPERVYNKHIAAIAYKNTELTKNVVVRMNGRKFSKALQEVAEEIEPIDIYIPVKEKD